MAINNCHLCKAQTQTHPYFLSGAESEVCYDCASKEGFKCVSIRIYKVPSYNLPVLADKFKRLGRRARKLELPEPTYVEHGTSRLVRVKRNDATGEKTEHVTLLHHITVDPGNAVIKVQGWTFVATIQHTEEGNILRTVGEQTIPAKYREVTQLCEHCNTNRNRKDTYLLRHDSGEYKQCGRQCLQDFFGHDCLMYAERASYLVDLNAIGEATEDEFGFGGGGGPQYDMLESYLTHVAECIAHDGWMSRSRARALGTESRATANIAMDHLHPPKNLLNSNWNPLYARPSEESRKLADASIAWASELEGENLSDYLHNIRVVARRGVVGYREIGIAASIVSSYQRHLGQLRQKELAARRAEISQFVGTVGERRVFKLHVEKVLTFERDIDYSGYGGTSYLHIMSDLEGNVFVWWSSGKVLNVGDDLYLKGSIKAHNERNSVKQTVLTRCEVVDMKAWVMIIDNEKHTIEAISEVEAKKFLKEKLGLKRLPNGTKCVLDIPEQVTGIDNEGTFTVAT